MTTERIARAATSLPIVSLLVRIDHVIYGAADLDVAAARVQKCLGLTTVAGGRHEGLGTHNRIVPLAEGYIELLAVADPDEAQQSPLGAALQHTIARGDGLFGWAVAVEDLEPVAARLGTPITTVGRQGMTARLAGVLESLSEPGLPFFIERAPGGTAGKRREPPPANATARITRLEVAVEAVRLSDWLGSTELPVWVVDGDPGVSAIGIGDRELRTV